jgi:hypothetical protein
VNNSRNESYSVAQAFRELTCCNSRLKPVPTKNSESAGKSRVLGWTALVSPASLSSCVRSFLFLPGDSVAGRLWN